MANTKDYSYQNAQPVLDVVEKYITEGRTLKIRTVYNELAIFDWWPEDLPVSRLKQMRSFLKTAIKLGFTGKVSFKVGATGCSNGMWAHKAESTDGYDPGGDYLYHSFTPAYSYWSYDINGKNPEDKGRYDHITTAKQLKEEVQNLL